MTTPTKWSTDFFEHLFGYEWELTKSPAGAHQWKPKGDERAPDARRNQGGLRQGADRREEDLARRSERAGGAGGVEQAAKNAGHTITVPFTPGRTDASQE
jgi:catalase (peroxidase I)